MERDDLIKLSLIILVLLLSGFIIGFLSGGKIVQDQWSSFYKDELKEMEKYCYCNYPKTSEGLVLDFTFNSS